MFHCRNGEPSGFTHKHTTVVEARRCWYPPATPVAASPPLPAPPMPPPRPVAVPSLPTSRHPAGTRMISPAQKQYINDLGGHWEVDWSYDEASKWLTEHTGARLERKAVEEDPRLAMIKGMIDMIPDGYYATAKDEGGHVDFLKVARPTRGRYNGSTKISSQHSERWEERMVYWPSGKWSVYDQRIIEPMMLVIADHKTCARRYSIELQKCCVCTTKLTDDRSRHYLIGPVCDQKPQWVHMIEHVDDLNDGLSFEQLVAKGMPTGPLGWQKRWLAAS